MFKAHMLSKGKWPLDWHNLHRVRFFNVLRLRYEIFKESQFYVFIVKRNPLKVVPVLTFIDVPRQLSEATVYQIAVTTFPLSTIRLTSTKNLIKKTSSQKVVGYSWIYPISDVCKYCI